jgi:hypothetical protein
MASLEEYSMPNPGGVLSNSTGAYSTKHQKRNSWQNRLHSLKSISKSARGMSGRQLEHSQSRQTTASSRQAKWWRIHYFQGMINDIQRRAPYYWSDWKDAWDYRVVPATVYMYFAKFVSLRIMTSLCQHNHY